MKISKIIAIVAVALCAVSCGTVRKSDSFSVGQRHLEIRMADLALCGETEISCEYDTYLGFIRHLTKVNGETYDPGNKVTVNIPRSGLGFSGRGMKLASAKLLKKFPEACYFQVVMDKKDTDVLFLGSTTKRTAKVRAYKLK